MISTLLSMTPAPGGRGSILLDGGEVVPTRICGSRIARTRARRSFTRRRRTLNLRVRQLVQVADIHPGHAGAIDRRLLGLDRYGIRQ
jgi:hypothetical protein